MCRGEWGWGGSYLGGRGWGRSGSGRGADDTSLLRVSVHRRPDGGWLTLLGSERPGPAGCGSGLRGSESRRGPRRVQGRGTAAELGLRSVSSRSADIPLGSVSVLVRTTAAASHLPFSAEKGRDCRKEEKEENARSMMGNVVFFIHLAPANNCSTDYISHDALLDQMGDGGTWEFWQ